MMCYDVLFRRKETSVNNEYGLTTEICMRLVCYGIRSTLDSFSSRHRLRYMKASATS